MTRWVIKIKHEGGFTTVARPLTWDVLPPKARENWARRELEKREPGATYVDWEEVRI